MEERLFVVWFFLSNGMVLLRIAWLSLGWLMRATTLGFDEEPASTLMRLLEPTTAGRLISGCSQGSSELRGGGNIYD